MKQIENITDEQYKELISNYAQEYLSETDADKCLYPMDEFDELMNGSVAENGALWLAQRIFFGNFNPNHDYFYFNGYANLVSTDDADGYYEDHIDRDYFLEWCDEQGYLDEYLEDEEEDEDESEDED